MRQFIRHPVDMPIEIGTQDEGSHASCPLHDLSLGGLAFRSTFPVDPGARIAIRISYVQPVFEAHARVAWCHRREDGGFEMGVTFLNAEEAFLARMVEQICHIEDYRKAVYRIERRELSTEEAAAEWIEKYAAHFPGMEASRESH